MAKRKASRCRCNLEDLGKPGKEDYLATDGKSCDEGHRWMSPKTISDAVEALIGAHYAPAAFEFMNWMNMEVDIEPDLAVAACPRAFVDPSVLRDTNLHGLESVLRYEFQNKALLVQAITHASLQGNKGGCCYQVLGDIIESIAGAIFLDTQFDFECVWKIMKHILSPIATPHTLQLQPLRELQEICSEHHWNIEWDFEEQVEGVMATGVVYLEESDHIIGTWMNESKRSAKIGAAQQILLRMEERGLHHSRWRNDIDKVTLDTNGGEDEPVEVRPTINADINLKVEPVTASNVGGQMEESEMVVSEHQTLKRKRCQDNTFCDSIMISVEEGDAYSTRHLESTTRELTLEDATGSNAKATRRFFETSVNSRTSQHDAFEKLDGPVFLSRMMSVEGGDAYSTRHPRARQFTSQEPIRPNAKAAKRFHGTLVNSRTSQHDNDNVNQNWCADDGLASSIITCHEDEENSVPSSQLGFSTGPPKVQGGPRRLLHEICQKNKWPSPVFKCAELGNSHKIMFLMFTFLTQNSMKLVGKKCLQRRLPRMQQLL